MDELIKKGAVELGQLIKKGETSSEEVVKAHLERIKKVNPEINAITISLGESSPPKTPPAAIKYILVISLPLCGV